jgi:hypothetical protein
MAIPFCVEIRKEVRSYLAGSVLYFALVEVERSHTKTRIEIIFLGKKYSAKKRQ